MKIYFCEWENPWIHFESLQAWWNTLLTMGCLLRCGGGTWSPPCRKRTQTLARRNRWSRESSWLLAPTTRGPTPWAPWRRRNSHNPTSALWTHDVPGWSDKSVGKKPREGICGHFLTDNQKKLGWTVHSYPQNCTVLGDPSLQKRNLMWNNNLQLYLRLTFRGL